MSQFKEGFVLIQDVIRLKWVPEILDSLGQGHTNFSSLLDSIPYLSTTELNRKLKFLQDRAIVEKDKTGEYILLPFGADLLHIFLHLQDLNDRYRQQLKA